jgi:hypothetical protein
MIGGCNIFIAYIKEVLLFEHYDDIEQTNHSDYLEYVHQLVVVSWLRWWDAMWILIWNTMK